MKGLGKKRKVLAIMAYLVFLLVSLVTDFKPGIQTGRNLVDFASQMLRILPFAFILIGLFEVWVPREKVERHMGKASGWRGYILAILLAAPMVGGLYVAFPMAYALYRKGAHLGVVFTFLGASSLCRIPMLIFEASFLGIKFSVARLAVSIPLVIGSSVLLGKVLEKRGYRIEMEE